MNTEILLGLSRLAGLQLSGLGGPTRFEREGFEFQWPDLILALEDLKKRPAERAFAGLKLEVAAFKSGSLSSFR